MNNHDGFVVAIEVGKVNKKYDIFEIKGKGLKKAPHKWMPRLSPPLN